MSGKGKSKLTQSSKSTSSKKRRNKRDIISTPPYSEFPATTSTFSGLVLVLLFSILFCGNTFASSISISLSGNVSLNLLKDNNNPVFGTSTTATANVTSDHFTGYTLTIQGANDSGKLENGDGSRYLTSIGEAISRNTFETDSNYNDQWGFLPSKYNSTDNNVYQPSPLHTSYTTIDVTNSPTSNNGNNYTLALGAKVTPEMALDSYGQTFILAATGNGYDYHIGFTDDAATLPDDIFGNSPQIAQVNLPNDRPTKSGFVFGGWCSVETTVDVNTHETTCPSGETVYQPGDPVTLYGDSANNLLLHAIWAKGYDNFEDAYAAAGKTKVDGYYTMQDMTPEICDSIVVGSPTTNENITKNLLRDRRNTSVYLIAKYADGHCWMRQNFDLLLTAGTAVDAYDFATDTVFSYTPASTYQTTTGTAWAEDGSDGARSYGGDKDKYVGGTNITNAGTIENSGQPYEKIGILYNWAAATAQTGAQAAAATGEVTTSICPKGWRLPANEGEYSFSNLMGAYGLPTTNQSQGYSGQLQNPLNFNRPGYYYWGNGTLHGRGTYGGFWSSVGYSFTTYAHNLTFDSTHFDPQHGDPKGYGFSVRCVAV